LSLQADRGQEPDVVPFVEWASELSYIARLNL